MAIHVSRWLPVVKDKNMEDPITVLAVADRFIDAWKQADADALRNIYAPDAYIWHNTHDQLQTVEGNIKSMFWIHRKLSGVNFEIQRRDVIQGGFFQQQVLSGTLASSEKFTMPACVICKVEDGRITSLEEYIDKKQMRPLMV